MGAGQFGRDEVMLVIAEAGAAVAVEMTVYLVGGGAMALRGDKEATKDVDLIVENEAHASLLRNVLEGLGFEVNVQPPLECRALTDAKILTSPRGMRIDLFVNRVCNKLTLSPSMRSRSELMSSHGLLSLKVCSREDIFLLKSVTERSRDLDDMMTLYRRGLNGEIILNECHEQARHLAMGEQRIWEAFLLEKVEEMETRFGVSVPWKKRLAGSMRSRLGAHHILRELENGPRTVPELAKALKMSARDVRMLIRSLEAEGQVRADRVGRPHIVQLAQPMTSSGAVPDKRQILNGRSD